MKLDLRVVGAAFVSGVALIVVGLIIGRPTIGIEGALFNRSVGSGSPTSNVFVQTGNGLADPADGNLWIGAGIAILLATAVLLVLVRRWRSRTRLPETSIIER